MCLVPQRASTERNYNDGGDTGFMQAHERDLQKQKGTKFGGKIDNNMS